VTLNQPFDATWPHNVLVDQTYLFNLVASCFTMFPTSMYFICLIAVSASKSRNKTCFGLCGVQWGLWSFLSVCACDVDRVSKSKNTHNTGLSLDELHIQNSTLVPALQPHTHTNIVNKCDIYIYTYHLFNHLFTHPK